MPRLRSRVLETRLRPHRRLRRLCFSWCWCGFCCRRGRGLRTGSGIGCVSANGGFASGSGGFVSGSGDFASGSGGCGGGGRNLRGSRCRCFLEGSRARGRSAARSAIVGFGNWAAGWVSLSGCFGLRCCGGVGCGVGLLGYGCCSLGKAPRYTGFRAHSCFRNIEGGMDPTFLGEVRMKLGLQ